MVDILDAAHSYSHSALSKMTRKKNSPQKKESETVLCARVTEFGLQFDVRKPIQKHNYKATGGSGKKALRTQETSSVQNLVLIRPKSKTN